MATRSLEYHSATLRIGAIITCSVILICIHKSSPVQSQFFTKTSKSIPRMGRRSDSGLSNRAPLSQSELPNQQSSPMLDPNMQDEMDANSVVELFRRNEKSGQPTIVDSVDNGSESSMIVSHTPSEYSLINMQSDAKQNGNSRWPRIVTSNDDSNDYNNNDDADTDYGKTSTHNNYVSSKSNHRLTSNYGERDKLAMRSLYLARLNQHLNSGQQFLSIPQLVVLSQSRSHWIDEPHNTADEAQMFSTTRQLDNSNVLPLAREDNLVD